jgi:hypothetical protein
MIDLNAPRCACWKGLGEDISNDHTQKRLALTFSTDASLDNAPKNSGAPYRTARLTPSADAGRVYWKLRLSASRIFLRGRFFPFGRSQAAGVRRRGETDRGRVKTLGQKIWWEKLAGSYRPIHLAWGET